MDTARLVCTAMVAVLMLVVSKLLSFGFFWYGAAMFAALAVIFICNGTINIPSNPPHKAVLVFLGKRLRVVLNEGWNWLPLHPFIFSHILIKVEKINDDLAPQEVRTPDNALNSVTPSITWVPGVEKMPQSYIAYLDSGGEKKVKGIIHSIIEDRVKTWAGSNKEGPSTWEEARNMKNDVHAVLAKSLLGNALSEIPERFQDVPTSTWMRFFDRPQSEPIEYDIIPSNGWGWKGKGSQGQKIWNWDGLQKKYEAYSDEERSILKEAIKSRREEVKKLREGNGRFPVESLGITIIRFTINEVKVIGSVAEAADLAEKERKEREADEVEIQNVSERVAELVKAHGISPEEAFKILQVERRKVDKTIIVIEGAATGMGQDLMSAASIARGIIPPPAPSDKTSNPSKKGGKKKPKNLQDLDDDDGVLDPIDPDD